MRRRVVVFSMAVGCMLAGHGHAKSPVEVATKSPAKIPTKSPTKTKTTTKTVVQSSMLPIAYGVVELQFEHEASAATTLVWTAAAGYAPTLQTFERRPHAHIGLYWKWFIDGDFEEHVGIGPEASFIVSDVEKLNRLGFAGSLGALMTYKATIDEDDWRITVTFGVGGAMVQQFGVVPPDRLVFDAAIQPKILMAVGR